MQELVTICLDKLIRPFFFDEQLIGPHQIRGYQFTIQKPCSSSSGTTATHPRRHDGYPARLRHLRPHHPSRCKSSRPHLGSRRNSWAQRRRRRRRQPPPTPCLRSADSADGSVLGLVQARCPIVVTAAHYSPLETTTAQSNHTISSKFLTWAMTGQKRNDSLSQLLRTWK